jgi:nicotinate-nucleotide adenylyltransferase
VTVKAKPHLRAAQAWRGLRIGVLGGSFNPAHAGHVHISLLALRDMGLDQIWWMVSPQNPLKAEKGMAPFAERMAAAEKITAPHPRLIVTDIETRLGTRYTADTLRTLCARFPHTRFVWMMGADNLLQIPRWRDWQDIFTLTDVAVYRRPSYAVGVLRGLAAQRFTKKRLPSRDAKKLARIHPTRWVLFSNRLNTQSATQIRNRKS